MPFDGALKPRLDVIGSGICGEFAAKRAAEAGYEVHLHEESPARGGGKIESSYFADGTVVNNGAEFIDTPQLSIRKLCAELNIPLVPATDQSQEVFQLAGGGTVNAKDFYAALLPIQQKVIRDKAIIAANPRGELAQKLDAMPLSDYLDALAAETSEQRSILSKTWHAAKELVSPAAPSDAAVAKTLAHIYGSEGGQDPQKISALQYVNEAPAEEGKLLASDCAFRVQGGTASIIAALEADLKSKGVQFHMGSKATSAVKGPDGKFTFENGEKVQSDKIALALPMYALGALQGLETLGFSAEDIALMNSGQYTHSAKFSIKTKQPASATDDTCLFSGDGFQAWRSGPDTMTFLAGGETLNQLKGAKLRDYCLGRYAESKGVKADDFFDTSQIIFRGPDTQKPCYASPAPGQALAMQAFARKAEALAENGVAVVGTYMPQPEPGNASIGFMDCGVQSVNRAAAVMFNKEREMEMAGAPQRSFVRDVLNRRAREQQAPNLGGLGQF